MDTKKIAERVLRSYIGGEQKRIIDAVLNELSYTKWAGNWSPSVEAEYDGEILETEILGKTRKDLVGKVRRIEFKNGTFSIPAVVVISEATKLLFKHGWSRLDSSDAEDFARSSIFVNLLNVYLEDSKQYDVHTEYSSLGFPTLSGKLDVPCKIIFSSNGLRYILIKTQELLDSAQDGLEGAIAREGKGNRSWTDEEEDDARRSMGLRV